VRGEKPHKAREMSRAGIAVTTYGGDVNDDGEPETFNVDLEVRTEAMADGDSKTVAFMHDTGTPYAEATAATLKRLGLWGGQGQGRPVTEASSGYVAQVEMRNYRSQRMHAWRVQVGRPMGGRETRFVEVPLIGPAMDDKLGIQAIRKLHIAVNDFRHDDDRASDDDE